MGAVSGLAAAAAGVVSEQTGVGLVRAPMALLETTGNTEEMPARTGARTERRTGTMESNGLPLRWMKCPLPPIDQRQSARETTNQPLERQEREDQTEHEKQKTSERQKKVRPKKESMLT